MKVKFANCVWRGEIAKLLHAFSRLCELQDLAQMNGDTLWVEEIQGNIDDLIDHLPDSVARNPRYALTPKYIDVLKD